MRKLLTAAALAATATAVPAMAQTIIYSANNYTIPAYTSATVFEEFERGVSGTQYTATAGGQASGGFVQTVTPTAEVLQGNVPGRGFTPDGDTNKYLSIESGSLNVNFGAGVNVFSFVFGSLDSYNTLTLAFSNGTSRTFTGREIIGGAPPASTFPVQNYGDTGRVTYDTGGAVRITSATFGSSGFQAFEIDSLASAVPEPATWGLMILGFGAIGAQLRTRRSRKGTLATA